MNILKNNHGFTLVTVLSLGLISMILIGTVFYLLTTSFRISGADSRYINELEVAKGIGEYIMTDLRRDNLTCNGSCSTAGSTIVLSNGLCTALGKTNCSSITATILSQDSYTPPSSTDPITYTSVQVVSQSENTEEMSIIEFVYKTS